MALYLFLDESGNLDFTDNGTRHYCFGTLATRDPSVLDLALTRLRYEMIEEGLELECFHATEDRQAVRDRVFQVLTELGGFEFDAVIVEKRKADPSLQDELRFYPHFANELLRHVFQRYPDPDEKIIVITDRLPIKRDRKAVEKAFKTYIRQHLGDRPFSILHHQSSAHPGLQASDYCMWAVARRWRNGDERSYRLIQPFIRSEVEIFSGEERGERGG
jgi:hypothetical protein